MQRCRAERDGTRDPPSPAQLLGSSEELHSLSWQYEHTYYKKARLYNDQQLCGTLGARQRTKQDCWILGLDYPERNDVEASTVVAEIDIFVKSVNKEDRTEVYRTAVSTLYKAKDLTRIPAGWPRDIPVEYARLGGQIWSILRDSPEPHEGLGCYAVDLSSSVDAPFRCAQLVMADPTRKRAKHTLEPGEQALLYFMMHCKVSALASLGRRIRRRLSCTGAAQRRCRMRSVTGTCDTDRRQSSGNLRRPREVCLGVDLWARLGAPA